ncbi:unnamed protein product [Meloidogyne enterolobii]|uniref:Uncharacterized protein n=1 Tax=Meloidogyne enterolobii TaxID=390850 RepID=A0ACB1AKT4_MELEN
MFRVNSVLQSIPKIFNSFVRRASVNRGLDEKSEKNEIDQITEMVPIEKRSLSRGAMLNKFEKDFMIFPEYLELAEIVNIKSYVGKLGDDLDKTIPHVKTSPGLMPSEIVDVLMKNGIFGAIIPKDFGGVGFQQKDVLQLVECISSRDLSIFTMFNNLMTCSNIILQFGTIKQKDDYLPGLATGKWRPAICWQEETTSVNPSSQVSSSPGQPQRLNAYKVNVVNAVDANLFVVFANKRIGDENFPTCYIIEKDSIKDPNASITIKNKLMTSGLQKCNFSEVVFNNVPVDDSLMLGESENARAMVDELAYSGKTLYGAAVVGFMKKALGDLCSFANQEVKGNMRLADSHPIKKTLSDMGLHIYILETMVYYIGGLTDENLFLSQDIENSIIQRFSNKAIRQAITTITEVAGIYSSDVELPYDKMIKDALALMSFSDPDLHLVRRITIPAIEHYVNHHGGAKTFMKTSGFVRYLGGREDLIDYLHPKLIHFIAEHVHPSLAGSAVNFEYCLTRLDKIIDILFRDKGVYLNTDYIALQDISTLMENNLAMISVIARASRAYSVGVRNSHLELDWTNYFCSRAAEESKRVIAEVMETQQKMININPSVMGAAKSLLDANGYCMDSPIEKNW